MIKQFLAGLWVALLASCAGTPQAPVDVDAGPSENAPEIKSEEAGPGSGPVSALSPDLLYLLLSAEIAGQRGEFAVALDGYLAAAKQTGDARIAERAVQIALFLKDTEKALEALAIWLAADPNSVSARKVATLLYLQQGQRDRALEQINALLAIQNDDIENTLLEIAKLLDSEAPADALDMMSVLEHSFADKPEVHFAYAGLALSREKLELALKQVRKALDLRPDWTRAVVLEAEIRAGMGDEEAARGIFINALQRVPEDARLRMVFAQYLVTLADYPAAEKEFERIVAERPDNHDALFALALVQLQLKQYVSSAKVLKQLVNVPKWSDQACLYLGRLEADNNHIGDALQWFDRVANGPLVLEAGLNAVSVAAANDRLSEAYKRLRVLRERFPKEGLRFYLIEAEILNDKKDYQGAFSVLTRALDQMPGQPELLYTRALTAEHLDRLDVLEADLKAILAENSDDANALNALGYTLADRTRRYEESRRYLERAIELKPNDPVVIDSYGWLQYRLGHYQQALVYLRRAYGLEQDPEIAAHLGEVLWMMGKSAEAQSIWAEVLEQEPGNEYVHRVRIRLMGTDDN